MFVPPNVNSFGNMSQHKATFCSNFLRLATRLNTHFMRQYVLLHGINGAAGSTDVFVSKTLSEIGKFFRLKILMIFLSLSSRELGHVEELNKKVAQKSSVTIMSRNEKLSHNIFKNCWQRQRRRRKGGKMCFHFSYQKCCFMLHQQRKFFYEILNWKKFSFVYSSLMNFENKSRVVMRAFAVSENGKMNTLRVSDVPSHGGICWLKWMFMKLENFLISMQCETLNWRD